MLKTWGLRRKVGPILLRSLRRHRWNEENLIGKDCWGCARMRPGWWCSIGERGRTLMVAFNDVRDALGNKT